MILLVLGVLVVGAGFAAAGLVVLGQLGTGWGEAPVRAQVAVACVLAAIVVGGLLGVIGQFAMMAREKRPPNRA